MKWWRYQICAICKKPSINNRNLKIFRYRAAVSTAVIVGGGGVLGAYALPIFGFGSLGVIKGSAAASIQGPAVASGSVFAMCQALGATGMYSVLFGSAGSALGGGALAALYKTRGKHCFCSCDLKLPVTKSKL